MEEDLLPPSRRGRREALRIVIRENISKRIGNAETTFGDVRPGTKFHSFLDHSH